MGEIDEEDEADEDEDGRAGNGNVRGVEDEELIRDEESEEDEDEPNENFWSPPSACRIS